MADSEIVVDSLTAIGGTQAIVLNFTITDPTQLQYLYFDKVEIWAAASNNRATAVQVGEGSGPQFIHTGLAVSTTRYYWARAKDNSGLLGEWYPVSATGGVSATTLSNALGPNSVGPTELQPGAVGNVHMQANSVTATQINVGSLSAMSSILGAVQAATITSGSVSGVTITASTFAGGTFRTATSGQRIEISGSTNRVYAYNSSNQVVASFGKGLSGETPVYVNNVSLSPAIYLVNPSTGGALLTNGHVHITGPISSYPALQVTETTSGTAAHAGRFNNNNGGRGLIGVSPGGGSHAFYAEAGGYGPFTGQHDGFILKDEAAKPGDIVIDTGRIIGRAGIDDAVGLNALAVVVADSRAFGVVSRRLPFDPIAVLNGLDPLNRFERLRLAATTDRLVINSLGEGQISVCGHGGDIEAGDLITTSTMPGKGQKQADDIMRASTVAKAREDVAFDRSDRVRLIACTYHCG